MICTFVTENLSGFFSFSLPFEISILVQKPNAQKHYFEVEKCIGKWWGAKLQITDSFSSETCADHLEMKNKICSLKLSSNKLIL